MFCCGRADWLGDFLSVSLILLCCFFFYLYGDHQNLHSFPTRRSSDLVEGALEAAKAAKDSGSTRFCMGAAWREVRDGEQ